MSTITSDSHTVVAEFNPDDSLLDGDFEIIARDVPMTQPDCPPSDESHASVGQWSIHHSILLDPLPFLNNLTSQTINNDNTIPASSPPVENSLLEHVANNQETPVLAGSMISTGIESLATTDDGDNSDSTLSSVIQKQDETKELLQQTLASVDTIKTQIAEKDALNKELQEQKKVNEELLKRINELELANMAVSLNKDLELQKKINEELVKNINEMQMMTREYSLVGEVQTLQKSNEIKDGQIKVLETAASSNSEAVKLQELIYEKDLQIDARDNSMLNMKNEMEAARREITDLKQKQSDKEDYLTMQLDVMCAKYLEEKQKCELLNELLRASQHDNGDPFSRAMFDQSAVTQQLRLKDEQIGKLEEKVKTSMENVQTKDAIIEVLREDHTESNRMLAEKEHKIKMLEQMIESYDRRLMPESS